MELRRANGDERLITALRWLDDRLALDGVLVCRPERAVARHVDRFDAELRRSLGARWARLGLGPLEAVRALHVVAAAGQSQRSDEDERATRHGAGGYMGWCSHCGRKPPP